MNKDIKTYNAKGQAHGYWESYWFNGDLCYKCVYYNNKEIGYEEFYNFNVDKLTKNYHL